MLHEVLLSLAGGPSPLLSYATGSTHGTDAGTKNPLDSFLSPAERSLLRSLAEDLGQKHKDVKTLASIISSSHPSAVCRAVSTAISSIHLAEFNRRILEVEKDILEKESKIVGAYNIVPLSAIAGAFDGWGRKLDWLWQLVQFVQETHKKRSARLENESDKACTAADVIRRLRDSIHTGYPDIEAMSRGLVKVSETAWLKQVSTWVVYGRYPIFGDADFFITRHRADQSSLANVYDISDNLIPPFVSKPTAQSILFIGKSLNHIKERRPDSSSGSSWAPAADLALLPEYLTCLSSLEYPLNTSSFSAAIGAIRLSLSQNALQKLLPTSKVVEILHILTAFFLLSRGEFAVSLITAAEDRLTSRNKSKATKHNIASDLASMTIKEGEVFTILARTWAALASLQMGDDDYYVDEELDRARGIISLSIKSGNERTQTADLRPPAASFDDLLLPAPTVLSLHVPSPLDLFLAPSDVEIYSNIHAYLLAIRRAHLRLSRLFSLSVLRREHTAPKTQGSRVRRNSFNTIARLRDLSGQRSRDMRPVWASIGSAVFFLSELAEYFQGEVVQSSFSAFHSWLAPNFAPNIRSTDSSLLSSVGPGGPSQVPRPSSSRSGPAPETHSPHDPETLTQAHRGYLAGLKSALLLDDQEFVNQLRRFMTSIDHLIGLMQRLDTAQQSSKLRIGQEHVTSGGLYTFEEQKIMEDLNTSRSKINSGVQGLIKALRAIDAARDAGRRIKAPTKTSDQGSFIPWAGAGVDRLLLKFDFGNVDRLGLPQNLDI